MSGVGGLRVGEGGLAARPGAFSEPKAAAAASWVLQGCFKEPGKTCCVGGVRWAQGSAVEQGRVSAFCWLCVFKYSNALGVHVGGWAARLAAGESPSREAVLKLRRVWSSSSKSPVLNNWVALGTHGAVWVVECCGSEASLPSGGTPLSE